MDVLGHVFTKRTEPTSIIIVSGHCDVKISLEVPTLMDAFLPHVNYMLIYAVGGVIAEDFVD